MDKELEDAVEKLINKHEERRLKGSTPPEKKKKMKYIDLALLVIVVIGLLAWANWSSIMPGEVERETIIVHPANVVLDSFEDRIVIRLAIPGQPITIQPANYVQVTFQLKNTGDEVATDVSCFIKCCDQNGTILFAQLFTFGDIGPDMIGKIPATVSYKAPLSDEVIYVIHNIDIRWSPQGTNTYMRLTEV